MREILAGLAMLGAASRTSLPPAAERVLRSWGDELDAARRSIGFDLKEPVGFSQYLLALYGQDADPSLADTFDVNMVMSAVTRGKVDREVAYDAVLSMWQRAMAPRGLFAARGLHSVGFMPGEDIAGYLYKRRREVSNYSMNAVVASWEFSTQSLRREMGTFYDPSLVNTAVRMNPEAFKDVGFQRLPNGNIVLPKMNAKTKALVKAAECPVVLAVEVGAGQVREWGADSESGETNEAEIKVKNCEPGCVLHLFVASRQGLGRPVPAAVRRRFALDSHIEVKGRENMFTGSPTLLRLHPDTNVRGKVVKHLPDGWEWYEVSKA
jgi:hypothetical protein